LERLSVVDGPVIYETDGDWAARYGATHAVTEVQRHAACEWRIHGIPVDIAHLGGRVMA